MFQDAINWLLMWFERIAAWNWFAALGVFILVAIVFFRFVLGPYMWYLECEYDSKLFGPGMVLIGGAAVLFNLGCGFFGEVNTANFTRNWGPWAVPVYADTGSIDFVLRTWFFCLPLLVLVGALSFIRIRNPIAVLMNLTIYSLLIPVAVYVSFLAIGLIVILLLVGNGISMGASPTRDYACPECGRPTTREGYCSRCRARGVR